VPEWFVYTSRAFLTLEGICLQADEDFSIISSCFPYVAKRLLTDDSDRARDALKKLVYGAGGSLGGEEGGASVDPARLVELAEGFSGFVKTSKELEGGDGKEGEGALAVGTEQAGGGGVVREISNVLLADSEDGKLNGIQNVLVDVGGDAVSGIVKKFLSGLPGTPGGVKDSVLKLSKQEEQAEALLGILQARVGGGGEEEGAESDKGVKGGKEKGIGGRLQGLGGAANNANINPSEVRKLLSEAATYAPGAGKVSRSLAVSLLRKAEKNAMAEGAAIGDRDKRVLERFGRLAGSAADRFEGGTQK